MRRKVDRWALVAALTLLMALAWDAKPTWGNEVRGQPVAERHGLAGRGHWSSGGDWRSPGGRGPHSGWRSDWGHHDRWRPHDRGWGHHRPHAGWWGAPWPPAPPVWVPGRWVWNGWGWVWTPGYLAY